MKKSLLAVWRDALGDSQLDSTAKLVGYAISTWMNGRGTCYPSRRKIAARCSLSDRAVDAAVKRLEADGMLAVQHRDGGNPKTGTNFYRATLPAGANELRRSEWERAKVTTPRGETDDASSERRSPESALKRRKAGNDAATPDGASSLPEDECSRCGLVRPLVGPKYLRCHDCEQGTKAAVA